MHPIVFAVDAKEWLRLCICLFRCEGSLSAVVLVASGCCLGFQTELNAGNSVLGKLLLAPLVGLLGRFCVLVEVLARGCRSLSSFIGQDLCIFKAKTEIVLS